MLEAKFKVGQQVYAVSNKSDSRQIHVKCDVCNSTGKVKVEGKMKNMFVLLVMEEQKQNITAICM